MYYLTRFSVRTVASTDKHFFGKLLWWTLKHVQQRPDAKFQKQLLLTTVSWLSLLGGSMRKSQFLRAHPSQGKAKVVNISLTAEKKIFNTRPCTKQRPT